jgi:predicted nucleic acid-binding Zn ribbon protein
MKNPKLRGKTKAPTSVARILEHTLGAYRLERKLEQYAAFPDWPQIVGEEIAAVALPLKIIRGNTLIVQVVDAAWAQELSMMKDAILERIFKHGKGATISDVRFVTGNPQAVETGR